MHGDRHGRTAQVDKDPRRRPSDGYRARDVARFCRVVRDAIAGLPPSLSRPLQGAHLRVEDIPPPPMVGPDGQPLLATFEPGMLTVYRRPVESRAETRADLEDTLLLAVGLAVARATGLDADPDDLFG